MDIPIYHLKNLFNYLDGNLIYKYSSGRRVKKGAIAGYRGKNGYCNITVCKKKYLLHRIIYYMHYGSIPKYIDHIDGNPSNNRIENLQPISHSQNILKGYIQGGAKGYSFIKRGNKYRAYIRINYKIIYLGNYKTEIEAKQARKNAEFKYLKCKTICQQ